MKKKTRIILGCGSGRCGTASLSVVLSNCRACYVTHELLPHLHWEVTDSTWDYFKRRLRNMRRRGDQFVGDVASVYLPYLERMWKLNDIYDWRGIILKRNREEVVQSFMRITGPRNNWQDRGLANPMFEMFFPKYSDRWTKEAALRQYWEDYYNRVEALIKDCDYVRVFPVDDLNTKEGQHKIFEFLEIPKKNRVVTLPCRYNVSNDRVSESKR